MTSSAPDPRRWRALAVCLIAGFMTLLDVSIVNVALPAMQSGLGASSAELSWVVSGYALTFGLVLVSSGRLGDDRGRRKMFLGSLALFTVTSALAGLATDPTWLVVARLLQGVAGGMLNPQVIGFIQQLFQGPERGRAFGLFGAVIGVSTAVGPLLGGLLLAWAGTADGWRWVFYVNVPIGVVGLVLGARLLPRDAARGEPRPLDAVGALLLGLAVVALMLPLVLSERDPAAAPWWLLGVAAVLTVAFVLWERRARRTHGHPLVDFALLRTRSYALGTSVGLLYFAGFTSIFFVLTLYFQQGLAYTPLEAGLALTPFAGGSAAASAFGGRVVARFGQPLVVVGLVVVAAGLLATDVVLRAEPGQVGWAIAGPLLVAGLGSGLVIAPNQTLALQDVPAGQGGTAAGVLQTGQRIGSAIGISAVGAVFFGRLASAPGDWGSAISTGLVVTVGLVVLALLVSIADTVSARRARTAAAAGAAGTPTAGGAEGTPAAGQDPAATDRSTPAHGSGASGSGASGFGDRPGASASGGGTGASAHGGWSGAPVDGEAEAHTSPSSSGSTGAGAPSPGGGPSVVPVPAGPPTVGGTVVRAVDGRVLDDHGAALPDAVATLVDAHGRQVGRTRCDPDGRYHLGAAAGASYQLVVGSAGCHPETLRVLVDPSGAPEVPDTVLRRQVPVGH
ncbi:EmrB/QacA subfamily drug resistance transporter [Pseudonocardia sediminis]|uniref:EmrB/QacA subfamily drug resistance transporter n=1 Tax=Pseudonocardia sediminis TaxID=1397368 RepID=A0A4Q7V0R4_PSEST|nr:MFS transporter [Pseudonocardia sediminis]RZT86183.1 EmrB/QacA subfamily drug resistance transporter [Pseudonocardia sediminis]